MFEIYLDKLMSVPLFQDIKKDELLDLLNCIRPEISNFEKDEIIGITDDKFKNIAIIIKGSAFIMEESMSGEKILLGILNSGDMFGEMAAFSGRPFLPATIKAKENSIVMFIPGEKIIGECKKLCSFHKTLIRNLLMIISRKALMLNRHIKYLSIKSMRGKICTFLFEKYKISGKTKFSLGMSKARLAEFLNVSRPSMSREICRMRDEEMIDFNGSNFIIKDMEKLKKASEF